MNKVHVMNITEHLRTLKTICSVKVLRHKSTNILMTSLPRYLELSIHNNKNGTVDNSGWGRGNGE